ncbi:MAG TPA: hypothetical protein VMY36_02720 [Patescibacteria group bacterium]|nr:hypothetical protein [Patescibacteria group bacterium]
MEKITKEERMSILNCVTCLLVLGTAVFLSKVRGKRSMAFLILAGFILLIALLNSGDFLIKVGELSQSAGNFILGVSQKVP